MAKGALHTLDFTRIKDAHRASARKLLVDPDSNLPNSLALQLSTSTAQISSAASTNAAAARAAQLKAGKGRLMTPEEKRRVVEALTRAKTADEVRRLERMLAEGVVPEDVPDVADADTDEAAQDGGMQVEGQEPVVAAAEGAEGAEEAGEKGANGTENGNGNGTAEEPEANGA